MLFMISMTLVTILHPGDPSIKSNQVIYSSVSSRLSAVDAILDLMRNMFPENIIEATMKRSQTVLVSVETRRRNLTFREQVKRVELSEGTNILGLIVFCSGVGIILSRLGRMGRIIVEFFEILEKVVMKFVEYIMIFAPIGIASLISSSLIEIEEISKMISSMALYVLTVTTCLILHCLIIVPLLFYAITRQNPWRVAKSMIAPFVTALGTASSGASLPQAINSVEEKLGIDPRIAGFIMPLGNTINMDGNALYEAVAAVFIAQINNIQLGIADIITISVTATFASIGLNAVPAGLVSMYIILNASGLPVTDIPLLFTIDWFIDRIRTALNVLGDAYCACTVQHFIRDHLETTLIKECCADIIAAETGIEPTIEEIEQLANTTQIPTKRIKRVSFSDYIKPAEQTTVFNETQTYSLKSAIIQPLRAHVALQARLSQLSEDNEN